MDSLEGKTLYRAGFKSPSNYLLSIGTGILLHNTVRALHQQATEGPSFASGDTAVAALVAALGSYIEHMHIHTRELLREGDGGVSQDMFRLLNCLQAEATLTH